MRERDEFSVMEGWVLILCKAATQVQTHPLYCSSRTMSLQDSKSDLRVFLDEN